MNGSNYNLGGILTAISGTLGWLFISENENKKLVIH